MQISLYIIAAVTFLGPIAAWAYIIGLAGAFSHNASKNGIRLKNYWDREFAILAALPWLLSIICLIFTLRMH
ncbi:hypothetical protein [Kiloniella majae]|uniref:hypothetical protein n=1 Tax=Kiloniella majae TaxID=1938558 RepID=UPI000A2780BD|nr:hypothetical protein [Kiloniella majae]